MDTGTGSIAFTLSPRALSFSVDVRLRRVGDRWLARVHARGEERIGLAPSAAAALAAAIEPLGMVATAVLRADVGLLEPSILVAQAEARSAG